MTSLDYIMKRAAERLDSIPDFESHIEIPAKQIIEQLVGKQITERRVGERDMWTVEYGNGTRRDIAVDYSDDADFQYFSTYSLLCDGTLAFSLDACQELAKRIVLGATYYKKNPPQPNDGLHYTVGNFIVTFEHGDFGTPEKPWLSERVRAFVPLICKPIGNGAHANMV